MGGTKIKSTNNNKADICVIYCENVRNTKRDRKFWGKLSKSQSYKAHVDCTVEISNRIMTPCVFRLVPYKAWFSLTLRFAGKK